MKVKNKLSWSLILVAISLLLATTVGYALYRHFKDPGLQNVNETGLITDTNVTTLPTVLPARNSSMEDLQPVVIGKSQTFEGITVTLDWVYLADGRQVFHISTTELMPDMRLGIPIIRYTGAKPEQYRGAVFMLDDGLSGTGTFTSNQLLRNEGQIASIVDMEIDIPLMKSASNVTTLHFNADDVPVVAGSEKEQYVYAVRVDGVEMRLEHMIVTPSFTEARLCYQLPTTNKDWLPSHSSIQFVTGDNTTAHPPVDMKGYIPAGDRADEKCTDVQFPEGKPADSTFVTITVDGLVVRDTQERMNGKWQFTAFLIEAFQASENKTEPTSQPVSETVGDITATLKWIYADANRIALEIHFEGWQDDYYLTEIALLDSEGNYINTSGMFGSDESDPATMNIEMNPVKPLPGDRFKGQLIIPVGDAVGPMPGGDTQAKFIFDLDLPIYTGRVFESGQIVTANGVEMMLQKVIVTPSATNVYLCYGKPTTAVDWSPSQAVSLQIGEDVATATSMGMIFDSDLGDVGKGPEPNWEPPLQTGHCVKLGFPVGHHDRSETLVLTVDALEYGLPESIPDADIRNAQEKLRAQGIEFTYTTFSGNGGGGSGWDITKKPDGMSDEVARQLIVIALGYHHPGPWVFTLEIAP